VSEGPKPEGATTILVMGILGIVLCPIVGIFAWVQGNSYLQQCQDAGVKPEDTAVIGRILGMISVGLMALSIIIGLLMAALGIGAVAINA